MNAIVYTVTHSFNDWIANACAKFNRSFNRVGYARAATELARLGYHEEAQYCLEQMRDLEV